jgi:hemoglobin-like flavoprotein
MIDEKTSQLLQSSWAQMSPHQEDIIHRFFQHLFKSSPELLPLFTNDIMVQSRQFAGMLNLIINGADQMETIAPSLDNLGKVHRERGIKKEQIQLMEDALIYTFGQELGKEFTPELETAWRESYKAITKSMID